MGPVYHMYGKFGNCWSIAAITRHGGKTETQKTAGKERNLRAEACSKSVVAPLPDRTRVRKPRAQGSRVNTAVMIFIHLAATECWEERERTRIW